MRTQSVIQYYFHEMLVKVCFCSNERDVTYFHGFGLKNKE